MNAKELPLDCIKQILDNEPTEWDQIDTFCFTFGQVSVKGIPYSCVTIDYEQGQVQCHNIDDPTKIDKEFNIKVELIEV